MYIYTYTVLEICNVRMLLNLNMPGLNRSILAPSLVPHILLETGGLPEFWMSDGSSEGQHNTTCEKQCS